MLDKINRVKELVNIEEVLRYYNFKIKGNRAMCRLCNSLSYAIRIKKNSFTCFKCDKSGSSLDIVCLSINCSVVYAAITLNNIFRLGVDFEAKTDPRIALKYKLKQEKEKEFKEWEKKSFMKLCYIFRSLELGDGIKPCIEHMLDTFIYGAESDKMHIRNKKVVEDIDRLFNGN